MYKAAGSWWYSVLRVQPEIRPGHVCRYKAAMGGPYLRYKEEILSVQPFASLFYDVVSDTEISTIKQHIKDKVSVQCVSVLSRAQRHRNKHHQAAH